MFSYKLSHLMQQAIEDELHIRVSIFDNLGNLISGHGNGSNASLNLGLGLEDEAPYVIPVVDGHVTRCYIVCDKNTSPNTISMVRMFANTLQRFSQRQSGFSISTQAESALARRLLAEDAPLFREDILSAAAGLGYHLNHSMAVIVIHLETNYNYCLNMDLGYESATDDAKLSIISVLRNHPFMNKHDLITFVQNDSLVIFKAIEELTNLSRLYEMQYKVMEAVDEVLCPYQIFSYYIAAGKIADSIDKVHLSYQEAVSYINYAKSTDIRHPIITWDDILYDSMVKNLPHGYYTNIIEPRVKEMMTQNPEMMDGLIQCFESYINNGFNVATTATNAYLHRNTVKKRMEKLYKLTGFDPMSDFKSILINKLILQQYQMEIGKER